MAVSQGRRNAWELLLDSASTRLVSWMRKRAGRHGDFRKLVLPMDDVLGIRVMATGHWELTALDAVRGLMEPSSEFPALAGGVFLDVGANIGLYSIALAEHFEHVFAFEPNPITFNVLQANIQLSESHNVTPCGLAVSDHSGEACLYTPANGNLTWSTLRPERWWAKGEVEAAIELDTLDNLAERLGFAESQVSLIKIDVEGHEAEVLRGATRLLARCNPIVLFEILSGKPGLDSLAILHDCGYSGYYTFRRKLTPSSLLHGLPIVFDKYDTENPKRTDLVCAVKRAA